MASVLAVVQKKFSDAANARKQAQAGQSRKRGEVERVTVTTLRRITDGHGALTRDGAKWELDTMLGLIKAAELLLSEFYVHLQAKRTLYAIDPVQALRSLRGEICAVADHELMVEREFHERMTAIFTSLRDPHTSYYLPDPFRQTMAFLPFMVESCVDPGAPPVAAGSPSPPPTYFVTKIVGDAFGPGRDPTDRIRVTHWNGVRIETLVARMALETRGSNVAGRLQRAADRLTLRWLGFAVGPAEDWVDLTYVVGDDKVKRTRRFKWYAVQRREAGDDRSLDRAGVSQQGRDPEGDWIESVRKTLYQTTKRRDGTDKWLARRSNGGIAFRTFEHKAKAYGYLRLYSFDTEDPRKYVDNVAELLAHREDLAGVVVDVRGNPGGNIDAAEGLVGLFAAGPVTAQGLHYLNTPESNRLATANEGRNPSLKARLDEARATGAPYVVSAPIASVGSAAGRQVSQGPVVVVVDALTYSASEVFTAGMQDHGLARIVGTTHQTGGGGGNVWRHDLIRKMCHDDPIVDRDLQIALNAAFDVAVRRTTRVRERAGLAVEDMGIVVPWEHVRALTLTDVLGGNEDLMAFAVEALDRWPSHRITVKHHPPAGFELSVRSEHAGRARIGRIDIHDADGTPLTSVPIPPPEAGDPNAIVPAITVQVPELTPGRDPNVVPGLDTLVFRAYLASGGGPITTYTWTR